MTLNSSGLFSRYEVSRTGRTSTSEPGRNARTLSISTVNPPLTRPVITPVTISELLNAVSRRVQVRARLAFSRERRVSPVPSSTESSATSTSSPGLTSTSPRSFLNCSRGMTASDLRPTLTMTTSGVTSTTSPVRIIPGRIRWLARLCSKSWAKLSVIPSLARCWRACTGPASTAVQADCKDTHHQFPCACRIGRSSPAPDPACVCRDRILRRLPGGEPQLLRQCGRPRKRGGDNPPSPSRPERAAASQRHHLIDHPVDGQTRRVDQFGFGRGLQWSDRAGRIPLVPLGDLARKGGKANIGPLVFQLLIATQRTLGSAGREKYLEVALREDN